MKKEVISLCRLILIVLTLLTFIVFTSAACIDFDGDDICDDWERKNGLPVDAKSAKGDPDEDGLTNKEEWEAQTDPFSKDSDRDGRSDKDEVDAGDDPLDSSEPTAFRFSYLYIGLPIVALLFFIIFYLIGLVSENKKQLPKTGGSKPPVRPMMPFARIGPRMGKPRTAPKEGLKNKDALFKVFDISKKEAPKEEPVKLKPKPSKKEAKQEPKQTKDAFSKLSSMAKEGNAMEKLKSMSKKKK